MSSYFDFFSLPYLDFTIDFDNDIPTDQDILSMEKPSGNTVAVQANCRISTNDQQIRLKVSSAVDHDGNSIKQRKILDHLTSDLSEKYFPDVKAVDSSTSVIDDNSISIDQKTKELFSVSNDNNDDEKEEGYTAEVQSSKGEAQRQIEPETKKVETENSVVSVEDEQSQDASKYAKGHSESTTSDVAFDDRAKCNDDDKCNEIEKGLNISLIPDKHNLLSDYNMMLAENIEFFQVSSGFNGIHETDGVSSAQTWKVGLRCIHCPVNVRHVTAATFFPSSVSTISSGIGTIGARHFAGGKCPNLSQEVFDIFKECKKTSQQQTRMQGRIGLDAYCKDLAKRENIQDLACGGIFVNTQPIDPSHSSSHKAKRSSQTLTFLARRHSSEVKSKELNIDTSDPAAFVEGAVEHFWECQHCNALPYHWRASGSVVFSATAPSLDLVRNHLSVCQGKVPLCIPRNATIHINENENENENSTSVVIRWQSLDKNTRKSGRIQKRLSTSDGSKKRRSSSLTRVCVHEDVQDDVLVYPEDKPLTTDFAYFTVLQLKKCFLTRSGGSRGNCPLGYPGLACIHCTGTNTANRRFFYTSADHLRNSFSHIPSHLATCTKCPKHVKVRIEELKETRSKQKSQLNIGDHKLFIDRLWDRLHGPDGGIIDALPDETFASTYSNSDVDDDDCSVSSISLDQRVSTSNNKWLDSDQIAIERTRSDLVSFENRKDVTDYVFYSLLQMTPKLIVDEKDDCALDKCESGISIPSKDNQTNDSHDVTFENQPMIANIQKSVLVESNDDYAMNKSPKNEQLSETRSGENELSENEEALKAEESKKIETDVHHPKQEIHRTSYTIVCQHCSDSCWQGFEPKSGDDLRRAFPEIPKHLLMCSKCPTQVKDKLKTFKSLRASQEACLKRGAQKKFMNSVWNRLERHFIDPNVPSEQPPLPEDDTMDYAESYVTPSDLVTENDRDLVTQFTFFTMKQMKPCYLEKSGNGARSMFHYGFPGLSCIHCADTPSARKFFYRTPDILSGNYAHIPNHVLSCKHCPSQVKRTLAEMKKVHPNEKMRLHRGSQRIFFNNIWERLHRRQS